jgi:hypothetical protein
MEQYTNVTYCKGWLRPKKKRAKTYTTEEAKDLYNSNKIYYATFENGDKVLQFIAHNGNFFYVGFLDTQQREYLKYQFQLSNDTGKLFLEEAQYWEYEFDTDKKIKTEIFQFTEDGKVTIHKVDIPTREGVKLTSIEPIDISGFYEDFPEFGKYDRLIRKDRLDSLNLESHNLQPIS